MMGLLSTIRGKKELPVIGSTEVGPIANKSKKMVIQEWPRLLDHQPNLFKMVWLQSANRSNSIKKAFGIGDNESPESSKSFINLSTTIEAFFYKLASL
uniref:GLOBIN domain-containing protein n=1 Tax=Heterorhabditis bacteriophora TaxID=37862 RepID=A0A1I7XTH8_HETBA